MKPKNYGTEGQKHKERNLFVLCNKKFESREKTMTLFVRVYHNKTQHSTNEKQDEFSIIMYLTSNALVQHANYFLEGLAPLERVQVAYSLFGKPAYDEIHSVQLFFR